jgi:hypothetical protein
MCPHVTLKLSSRTVIYQILTELEFGVALSLPPHLVHNIIEEARKGIKMPSLKRENRNFCLITKAEKIFRNIENTTGLKQPDLICLLGLVCTGKSIDRAQSCCIPYHNRLRRAQHHLC